MPLVVLCCQPAVSTDFSALAAASSAEFFQLPEIPTRKDLKILDEIASEALPVDPTPSLDEIMRRPDVAHMSAPTFAPQQPEQPLRVVVIGTDAALSAVLTRLMRADNLWASIGFVPVPSQPSVAAKNWGLQGNSAELFHFAATGAINPAPLIRDDSGIAVAGCATISNWESGEITGEIIVDDHILIQHVASKKPPRRGVFGARLVPMLDAPGIAAAVMDTPLAGTVSPRRLFPRPSGTVRPNSLSTGRALQAGGVGLLVQVDGVPRKRAVERVTFYRHLRDLQIVRP